MVDPLVGPTNYAFNKIKWNLTKIKNCTQQLAKLHFLFWSNRLSKKNGSKCKKSIENLIYLMRPKIKRSLAAVVSGQAKNIVTTKR